MSVARKSADEGGDQVRPHCPPPLQCYAPASILDNFPRKIIPYFAFKPVNAKKVQAT